MLKLTGRLEQEVLNVLWDANTPLIPSEVQSKLKKNLAYTTVMTMLQRMYKKGTLKREKRGNAYAYCPTCSKEKAAQTNLKNVFQGLLSSYGDLAVTEFLDTLKDSPRNRDMLKEYLNEKEKK